jgi:hypothetical protein
MQLFKTGQKVLLVGHIYTSTNKVCGGLIMWELEPLCDCSEVGQYTESSFYVSITFTLKKTKKTES